MATDRRGIRGVVLAEDKRTERFVRHLLEVLGFEKRSFRFEPAPAGRGAAEAWVLANYPGEVKVLRAKAHQRLGLIAVRDGDREGVTARKAQLEVALREAGLTPRSNSERISTPVPTWSIENWLLALLEHADIDEGRGPNQREGQTWKQIFDHTHGGARERNALKRAAKAWRDGQADTEGLPSRADGRVEISRLDNP